MTEQTKIDYVDLVLNADIPTATMKHVLLTIAVLANENGRCRPSIARLAILTGLDKRTITRTTAKLEKEYWLYVDRPGTPTSNETNFYMLGARKCQIDKVNLTPRSKKYKSEKVGAQDPHSRGTVSPNTTKPTPAPRPTAAPQAQAGGSGAGSKVKEEVDTNIDSLFANLVHEDTEPSEPFFDLTEPEEATAESTDSNNPYEGRKYITQAEFDEAIENGFSLFDLPEVMDEQEEVNMVSPLL